MVQGWQPADDATLDRILTALDRLPLAIELAASRCHVLSLDALERLLQRRFELLRRQTPATIAVNHLSLEDALAWSYAQLNDAERRVMQALSAMPAGGPLEVIQHVLQDDIDTLALVDTLGELSDRSLVQHEQRVASPLRYRLLISIREYVLQQGQPTQHATYRTRYAQYLLTLIDRMPAHRDPLDALRQRGIVVDDVLDLYRHLRTTSTPDVERVTHVLAPLLGSVGPNPTLASLAHLPEPVVTPPQDPHRLAQRLEQQAREHLARKNLHAAQHDLEQAVTLLDPTAPSPLGWSLLRSLARVQHRLGQPDDALRALRQALQIAQQLQDPRAELKSLTALGRHLQRIGQHREAIHVVQDALRLAEQHHDTDEARVASLQLAQLMHDDDQFDDAIAYAERALTRVDADADPQPALRVLIHTQLALSYTRQHAFDRAATHLTHAQRLQRQHTPHANLTPLVIQHALLSLLRNDPEAAEHALASIPSPSPPHRFAHTLALALLIANARPQDTISQLQSALAYATLDDEAVLVQLLIAALSSDPDAGLARCRAITLPTSSHPALRPLHTRIEQDLADGPLHLASLLTLLPAPDLNEPAWLAWHFFARPSHTIAPTHASPVTAGAMVVAHDYTWIHPTPGERIDITRPLLHRLIAALVTLRLDEPNTAISAQALIEAGWPGERMQARAAKNRLYNAIHALRQHGFEDLLQTRNDGYLLDPSVTLLHAKPSPDDPP